MISTIIQARTLAKVLDGMRDIYFRRKPHWDARFEGCELKHRSILLLSGRKCVAFTITKVEDTGGSFKLTLGDQIKPVKQGTLFPEQSKQQETFIPGEVCV